VADKAASKQGRYLPGSHIPILAPDDLAARAPDAVLILPWNLVDEVISTLRPRLPQGTTFVTAIPHLTTRT
jgi:hypothetical protein